MEPQSLLVKKPDCFWSTASEMGKLMSEKDWTTTPLGNPDTWPQSLQTAINIILDARFPMFIWWGPDLLCFYNDAYRPSLGNNGKHPHILGTPAQEAWPEIWEVIYPLIRQVLDEGKAVWMEDQLIPIFRNGCIEDVYWTFSYSRLYNDWGQPAGVLVTCAETTDQVKTKKKLEDSNNRLHFAIEAAELGTWDYDPINNIFSANARLKEWFGLYDDIILLPDALDRIDTTDRQRVVDAIQQALTYTSGGKYDISYSIIHPVSGEKRIVRVKGKANFNAEQIAYRFNGTMEDITTEVSIQKALLDSEQQFRNLIERAPVAMCVFSGADFIVELANEKMLEVWGKSAETILHQPLFEGVPEAKNKGFEEMLQNVYQTGQRFSAGERPSKLPRLGDAPWSYIDFVVEPLKASDGSIDRLLAVAIDVSEKVIARQKIEEAEERARLAMEGGNIGTFDHHFDLHETFTSAKAKQIFGLPEDAISVDFRQRIHPEDLLLHLSAVEQAVLTGKLSYEARLILPHGEVRWIRVEGKTVYNDAHQAIRMLGTILDISDIKETDQKREEYIAIASHELRNPLTSLKLSIDLLTVTADFSTAEMLIGKAKEQVKRIMTLTNELLNVSKISSGILDLKPDIFNFTTLIQEAVDTFNAGFTNKISITGNTDITLRADKFRIEQVLINLLSNAAKYSPADSPIEIHVEQEERQIKVQVIDQGIGIDPEKLPHVFKKYTRAVTSQKIDGFGLGLYISEQIIHKHEGQIGVITEKGKGSTFWFTIPY